jgi:hypothetical protein
MIKGFWNQSKKITIKSLNLHFLMSYGNQACSIEIDGLVDSTITSVPRLETLVK